MIRHARQSNATNRNDRRPRRSHRRWTAAVLALTVLLAASCAGTASACPSESDYTAIAAPRGVRGHDVRGKAEGRYTYRLQACYGSGRLRRRTCNSSETVTVVVSYLAGTEAEKANATGGMPYGTGVTKGGDAYVNIPVAVVPGVNGLQPALSMTTATGATGSAPTRRRPATSSATAGGSAACRRSGAACATRRTRTGSASTARTGCASTASRWCGRRALTCGPAPSTGCCGKATRAQR